MTQGSFPNGLDASVAGGALRTAFVEQHPKSNYVQQWNLDVQRELGHDLMVEVAYVGTHGVHSPFISSDINTVQPTHTVAGYVWPTPQGSGTKPLPAKNPAWWDSGSTAIPDELPVSNAT